MPIPKLIHPVEVEFQLTERGDSFFDQQAREPVRQVVRRGIETDDQGNYLTSVVIKGQASFYFAGAKLDYNEFMRQGILDRTVGYIAVRFIDMKKKGLLTFDENGRFEDIKIKRTDRIIRVGDRIINVFVTGFKDFAHYPKINQTMIQINFDDRHPSAQNGDL